MELRCRRVAWTSRRDASTPQLRLSRGRVHTLAQPEQEHSSCMHQGLKNDMTWMNGRSCSADVLVTPNDLENDIGNDRDEIVTFDHHSCKIGRMQFHDMTSTFQHSRRRMPGDTFLDRKMKLCAAAGGTAKHGLSQDVQHSIAHCVSKSFRAGLSLEPWKVGC